MLWFDPATLDCPGASEAVVERAAAYASALLYHLTGRRWPGEVDDVAIFDRWPGPCVCSAAQRRNAAESGCACMCGGSARLELPGTPVIAVSLVAESVLSTVDPEDVVTVASSAYRVDDGRTLVRLDGNGWHSRTVVTYTWGGAPPDAVDMARTLACEVAKSWAGCKPCRLPTGSSVTRQGVTVTRETAASVAAAGGTGLGEVDQWVAAVLLGDKRRQGQVIAPEDWPNRVRRTA